MWIIFESKVAGAIYCYCICRNGYLVLKGSVLWFIQLQKGNRNIYIRHALERITIVRWLRPVLTDFSDTCIKDLWFENWAQRGPNLCIFREIKKLPLTSLVLIMARATLASYTVKLLRIWAQKSKVLYLANLCHLLKFVVKKLFP